jgi:hypothetical protein
MEHSMGCELELYGSPNIITDNQTKEDWMDGACGMHGDITC